MADHKIRETGSLLSRDDGFHGAQEIIGILALLNACTKPKDLEKGIGIHADILKKKLLVKSRCLASCLVNMYAKCGALDRAVETVDSLSVQDVPSWNALISGYVRLGHEHEALKCFRQLQQGGLSPNAVTFTCILRACGCLRTFDMGEEIHYAIAQQGLLGTDVMLDSALVDMYVKCGKVAKAGEVLDNLPVRNAATWTALIEGYTQHGLGEEALKCFRRMQCEGLHPDIVAYTSTLKACGSIGALESGEEILYSIIKQGLLEADCVLGTTLVDMYVKCGALAKAASVLEKLPGQDAVSWNALIAGYTEHGQDEDAVECLEHMRCKGVCPDAVTFKCILKSCGSRQLTGKGEMIHQEILSLEMLEKDDGLVASLVDMYVKCGALGQATRLLDKHLVQDVAPWRLLIAGHSQHGQQEEVLKCFEQMQSKRLCPDAPILNHILKACGSMRIDSKGKEIHKEISRQGLLGNDVVLGTALVDMYIKCGDFAQATHVFDELLLRDTVSWNALIAGYAEDGQGAQAIECFKLMQCEGLYLNMITCICISKACGSVGEADLGEQIHNEITGQGFLEDGLLGNSLVDMYVKCGAISKAEQVLDDLPVRDVVAWNALIAGYAQLGWSEEALKCYEHMHQEGLYPDTITLTCIAKACDSIEVIDNCEQMNRQKLLQEDILLGTTFLHIKAKCSALSRAAEMLDGFPIRDAVAWNALIVAYAQQELCDKALECFEHMKCEGLVPDAVTYCHILKACGNIGMSNRSRHLHDQIVTQGLLGKNLSLGSSVVDMYAKSGALRKAAQVLDSLCVRDKFSWNALLGGYANHGHGHEALQYFKQMQDEGLFPNTATFALILKACGIVGAIDSGEQVHVEIARRGLLGKNPLLGTSLIDMYAKCGALNKADQVFSSLPVQDVASWNALIAGYVQQGEGEKALKYFEELRHERLSPTAVTFMCTLKACSSIGAADMGEVIHHEILQGEFLIKDAVLGNSLIDMYAKCGALAKAAEVLDELPVRGLIPWNLLIGGCAQQGQGKLALKFVERMQQEGLLPDSATLMYVLSACSRSGLLIQAQMHFTNMYTKYGLMLGVTHQTCMVHFYGREGRMDMALEVLDKLQFLECLPAWNALLCSCQECGNVIIGRWAFDKAVKIHKDDAAAYILMAKIYAAAGMHEHAKCIETMREQALNEAKIY